MIRVHHQITRIMQKRFSDLYNKLDLKEEGNCSNIEPTFIATEAHDFFFTETYICQYIFLSRNAAGPLRFTNHVKPSNADCYCQSNIVSDFIIICVSQAV